MAEELTNLYQHFNKALKIQTELVVKQTKELEASKKQFENEKLQMASKTTKEDVIELNVGGTLMTTTRRTLCVVQGSMLEIMFSGRWEGKHTLDKNGIIFLDVDPEYFTVILRSLRSASMQPGEPLHKVIELKNVDKDFSALVDYFGIIPALVSLPLTDSFSADTSVGEILVEPTLVQKLMISGHCAAFGSNSFEIHVTCNLLGIGFTFFFNPFPVFI